MKNKKKIINFIIFMMMCAMTAPVLAAESLDGTNEFASQSSMIYGEDTDKKESAQKKTRFKTLKKLKFWGKNDNQSEDVSKTAENNAEVEEKPASKTEKSLNDNKKTLSSKAEKTDVQDNSPSTDILVDSETIEYYPERHEFEALGNARVTFPSEGSVLEADKIVFNHDTNHVTGLGNVVLIRAGQKVYGDYIKVDLNENNAMMSRPVLNHLSIKINAKQGIVSDVKTEAIDGKVTFNDKAVYKFMSRPVFGFNNPMMEDAIPKHFYFKEKYENKWRLKAKTIIIDSYKDRDVATLKNADIYLKNTKIGSSGKMRLFTDKEQQYIETNMLEMGSLRNIGAFLSPGYVFQTPNASTLKLGPALTYDHEIGVGAVGRFMTDKNRTAFGWGSSKSKIVIRGEQEVTDNLKIQYGLNSYMNNFFMGSRMPKYGVQFIHHKSYDIEDLGVNFTNRFTGGFYRDWGSHDFSTVKGAWQTQTSRSLFKYKNEERKFAADAGVSVQTHAAVYGTGDTMGVVRVGPYLRTQYRSWQQYLAYFQGGQAGDSPMYFDRNFYGKSNIMLGESLRICKYLTLMYAATIVVSNDTPNDTMLQENRFFFLIGPDDLKFMIGYDAYRQNATMGFSINIGAENSDVEFKRLVLNDPEAIGKKQKSEREKLSEQRKKEAEERKRKQMDTYNRSVKDYDDYRPNYNNMLPGSSIHPSMYTPMGM